MTTKKPTKRAPAKAGAAANQAKKIPVSKLPVRVGSSYELTSSEQQWFDDEVRRIDGLTQFFGALDHKDRQIIRQGLGASIGYSHLEEVIRFVQKIFPADDWNGQELLWYLERATTGFKLAMKVAESSLEERQVALLGALTTGRKAAEARWSRDPKSLAMNAIRAEFDRWQAGKADYESAAAFARAMCMRHPEIGNEGSIQNRITKWKAERENS